MKSWRTRIWNRNIVSRFATIEHWHDFDSDSSWNWSPMVVINSFLDFMIIDVLRCSWCWDLVVEFKFCCCSIMASFCCVYLNLVVHNNQLKENWDIGSKNSEEAFAWWRYSWIGGVHDVLLFWGSIAWMFLSEWTIAKGKCVISLLAKTLRGIFVCSRQNLLSETAMSVNQWRSSN